MNSNLFKNVYGQFHTWFQTTGIFIVAAVVSYFVQNSEWTWKGLGAAVASALLTYVFTADDHKKTVKAASIAAQTGDVTAAKQDSNGGV